MFLITHFFCLKKSYIFFFLSLLFIILSISKVESSTFKVNDIKVTEPFNSNFKKQSVIDKAIIKAFEKLLIMTIPSEEMSKIKNYKASEIKNLIDSFNIKDEKFVDNNYNATFEITFNKQNTFLFIEKKNIYPSIPNKKKVILLPILVDNLSESVNVFNQNPFFSQWNSSKPNYHLIDYILLPEDIDLVKILNDNINNLENYDFSEIIKKNNFNEYIICLIYKESDKFKIFSKIKFNDKLKIKSKVFLEKNISSSENIENLINKIKLIYEDEWKNINRINRSVKLPINLSISSKNFKKNEEFQNFLSSTDLVSKYLIKSFNNTDVNYKIIFNGSPKQFLSIAKNHKFNIETNEQIWKVKYSDE